MPKINYNGHLIAKDTSIFNTENRAWRYGEGLIETMFWHKGNIPLHKLHFDRLHQSLITIGFPQITHVQLLEEIQKIEPFIQEEQQMIRAQFFCNENILEFVIEGISIESGLIAWNEKGLNIGIAPIIKGSDNISHLKSTSRLNYIMAKKEADINGWDDALLLNQFGRIAESTISNVFIIKDQKIFTPPLQEGCIAGVMRHYLLQVKFIAGMAVHEMSLDREALLNADEVFLTNAIRGVQPVKKFENKNYQSALTRKIFDEINKSLISR